VIVAEPALELSKKFACPPSALAKKPPPLSIVARPAVEFAWKETSPPPSGPVSPEPPLTIIPPAAVAVPWNCVLPPCPPAKVEALLERKAEPRVLVSSKTVSPKTRPGEL
jgi:hypothetical protein